MMRMNSPPARIIGNARAQEAGFRYIGIWYTITVS